MEQKKQKDTFEEHTLRYRLFPLLSTYTPTHILPLNPIELILDIWLYLQLLKYSVDYFSTHWVGHPQPIFSYLDLGLYIKLGALNSQTVLLSLALGYMTIYWLIQLILFLKGVKLSNLGLNIKKLIFLVTKNVLLLPLLDSIISLFNTAKDPYHSHYPNTSVMLQVMGVLMLLPFLLMLILQSLVGFQFLKGRQKTGKYRRSAYLSTSLVIFVLVGECSAIFTPESIYLFIVNGCGLLLLVLFGFKNQHLNQLPKLLELSFLFVNQLGIIMVNLQILVGHQLNLMHYLAASVLVVATTLSLNTLSLEFQIQNINKWPTSEIMIRYASNLWLFLSRKHEYMYDITIHGYMEIHRQKCDSEVCPSRCPFTQHEQLLFQNNTLSPHDQDLLRCQNIIKKVFKDGDKQTPINSELLLQNSIFLYEKGEPENALTTLLQTKTSSLPLDSYYKYAILREKIHTQLVERSQKPCLDLVSELRVRHEEGQILNKMEKGALINMQFWSILNEEHPDYTKLKQVASKRMQMRERISKSFSYISSIANDQRIISQYVNYLQAIQNDEQLYHSILQTLQDDYELQDKILLQDWANTSHPIMVASVEEGNQGMIIDVNSSCALLLGYQKYEMLNHTVQLFLPEDLGDDIGNFLNPHSQQRTYFVAHKNGFLLRVEIHCQNYNSIETGMATVVHFKNISSDNVYYTIISKKHDRVLGISSSFSSLISFDQPVLEEHLQVSELFQFNLTDLLQYSINKSPICLWELKDILQSRFLLDVPDNRPQSFKLSSQTHQNCRTINIHVYKVPFQTNCQKIKPGAIDFQFQVQATLTSFKYFGCYNSHQSYLSQFSQLSFAETLQQGNPTFDYGEGIKILRLKDNIIQHIEDFQHEEIDGLKRNNSQSNSTLEQIPQKEEESIFDSRKSFIKFIDDYTMGWFFVVLKLFGKAVQVGCCILCYILLTRNNLQLCSLTKHLSYNSIISGEVAKQYSLLLSIKQLQNGQSAQPLPDLISIYNSNIRSLQTIHQLGGPQYNISVFLGVTNVSFLNTEFTLSLLDNSKIISSAISTANTTSQLLSALTARQMTSMNYLLNNCPNARDTMMTQSRLMETAILESINFSQRWELLMLLAAGIFCGFLTTVELLAICRIRRSNYQIFQIFLDISDIQIQTYSSKSQKFLMSLHVEDINGQIDIDEEVQNTRKISSSTFTKKKRFKNIDQMHSFMLKILLVLFLNMAFFIHSFAVQQSNLNFQTASYQYHLLTTQGEYKLYTGLTSLQQSLFANQPPPQTLSKSYFEYYQQYFHTHYQTYSNIPAFHQAFTKVYMNDICNGSQTAYGSTTIPQSCNLPLLYPKGSLMVFTDVAMKTDSLLAGSVLNPDYLTDYQVLSKTHRMNSFNLMQAHKGSIEEANHQLQVAVILWVVVLVLFTLLFILGYIRQMIAEMNRTKGIITILPISIAHKLPKLTNLCNSIIKGRHCC